MELFISFFYLFGFSFINLENIFRGLVGVVGIVFFVIFVGGIGVECVGRVWYFFDNYY